MYVICIASLFGDTCFSTQTRWTNKTLTFKTNVYPPEPRAFWKSRFKPWFHTTIVTLCDNWRARRTPAWIPTPSVLLLLLNRTNRSGTVHGANSTGIAIGNNVPTGYSHVSTVGWITIGTMISNTYTCTIFDIVSWRRENKRRVKWRLLAGRWKEVEKKNNKKNWQLGKIVGMSCTNSMLYIDLPTRKVIKFITAAGPAVEEWKNDPNYKLLLSRAKPII